MELKQVANTEQFLSGGGELGELIRSKDWSKTALGPVSSWPQSLRTCVRIILTSRQPMFVWWGPELINIYNDAYKAIVGGKHPEALGQPASEVWREIWDQVGPRAATVMNKNEGTYDEALLLVMERNGYPEETYYTFSYSPVPGDTGDTAGIICANTDDTAAIIGERQLRTLKDLGKNIADVQTDTEVYQRAMGVLKQNPQDFPFILLYKIEEDGRIARLIDSSEAELSSDIAPAKVKLDSPKDGIWPLNKVVSTNQPEHLQNVAQLVGTLPSGAWEKPPDNALLLPISQSSSKQPYAVMVIGQNPYRLLDDKYMSFFQLVTDQIATSIANVHAYEEERKRAEALAEIDKTKTAFFSNVSHEFRTPLTLMLGPLEDLMHQSKTDLPQEYRDSITATHRNAMRLLKLVNTLLDFSRIEAGRIQAEYRPIDLCTFTTDLASSFRSIIEKAGLTYQVHCENPQEQVYVDKEMWEKIVLNLLSNAFKYTLSGNISLSLEEIIR
jgi:signal transduction histidine kinase